jgi:short subunit dehydrogenase-like uncharacterized protein
MKQNQIVIYGSYGYTGDIIVEDSLTKNFTILLSGRDEQKLKIQSQKTGYPYKAVDLNKHQALVDLLTGSQVLINAAGPFKHTATQMIEACIEAKTHYMDINGDISVFELIKTYDYKAKFAGIMLLPGTGFDVVPTDCLALKLKQKMPKAIHLKIAFANINGGISHGTATTVASRLGEKAVYRKNGKLTPIALGKKGIWVDFGEKKLFVMSIPWGDISTAFVSTGIPNIESYMAVKPFIFHLLKFQFMVNWALRTPLLRSLIQKNIDAKPAGQNKMERDQGYTLVWAQIMDIEGKIDTLKIRTPNAYSLTATATLRIAEKILNGDFKAGYQTPAKAYGENLIFEIEGVKEL